MLWLQGPELAIHHPDAVLDAMNEWSREHHGASGLTDRCRASIVSMQVCRQHRSLKRRVCVCQAFQAGPPPSHGQYCAASGLTDRCQASTINMQVCRQLHAQLAAAILKMLTWTSGVVAPEGFWPGRLLLHHRKLRCRCRAACRFLAAALPKQIQG